MCTRSNTYKQAEEEEQGRVSLNSYTPLITIYPLRALRAYQAVALIVIPHTRASPLYQQPNPIAWG